MCKEITDNLFQDQLNLQIEQYIYIYKYVLYRLF